MVEEAGVGAPVRDPAAGIVGEVINRLFAVNTIHLRLFGLLQAGYKLRWTR